MHFGKWLFRNKIIYRYEKESSVTKNLRKMSNYDQRPVSLAEYASMKGAELYRQKLEQSNTSKPVDIRIHDQMVAGRQTIQAHQGMGDFHVPPHLLKNDLKRNAIDERQAGELRREDHPAQISPAQVLQLKGVESLM